MTMSESGTGSSILLVDDDQVFCRVLSRALQKRGYQVSLAHNLDDAVREAKLRQHGFAVIDLKIGHESGLELIPRLQAVNPDIRMLILTGYSSIATAVAAIKMGAMNYACKPVDADEILALLDKDKAGPVPPESASPRPPSIKRLQWEHIQKVLEENQGNISATARSLGMHRRTLQRMLQKKPVRH